jgi:hypothetical protein
MIKKILVFVLPLFVTFTMCKKEKNFSPSTSGKIPIDIGQIALTDPEFEALYDSVLMAAYWGLLDLSKSATFKSLVNTEVANEFDGDVNVLLKVLVENWSTLEDDMESSIIAHYPNPALLTKFVSQAVNGFEYFDMFVYPQIYIPFDDQVTLTDNPVITLNLNDSTILPGHYINGSSVYSTQNVDEDYAEENLVWVVSVNESLESETDYDNREEFNIVAETVESPSSDTTVTGVTYGEFKYKPEKPSKLYKKAGRTVGIRLTEFKVTSRNENFGGGKSELLFVSGLWSHQVLSIFNRTNPIKFKKDQLNEFLTISEPNQISLITQYEEIVENNWCLIFEKDTRKKYERSFNPASFDGVSDQPDVWKFRSQNPQYGDMNCHWVWWSNDHNSLNTTPKVIDCSLNSGSNHLKFKVTR